jgi:hypothetical protein
MAEVWKKRRKQQPSKTASRTANRKSSGAIKTQPAAGGQDAGDRLRAEINKAVKANSRKIAKAMVDRTIGGNAGVARLLVDFTGANKQQKPPAKKPGGLSMAQGLASEPPWQGAVDPDDGDFGVREPEV